MIYFQFLFALQLLLKVLTERTFFRVTYDTLHLHSGKHGYYILHIKIWFRYLLICNISKTYYVNGVSENLVKRQEIMMLLQKGFHTIM